MMRSPRARSAIAVVIAVALCAPMPIYASQSTNGAVRAAEYLVSRQDPNGAFGSAEQPADYTAESAAALVAAGTTGRPLERALAYVRSKGSTRAAERAGVAGRIVTALVGLGVDPRAFGFDYVAQLESYFDPVTGAYDTGNRYANALAALGVSAVKRALPERALTYIRAGRCPGGGFSSQTCVAGGDVDTTAIVLNVLARAEEPRDGDALTFLRAMQNADGGFGLDVQHPETNANSTGLALSAFSAAGERAPAGAMNALLGLQTGSGGFKHKAGAARADDYATVQAIGGVLGLSYPLHARATAGLTGTGTARSGASTPAPEQSVKTAAPCEPDPKEKGTHRAGLVVMFGDGRTRKACISFPERSITGFELLKRSKIPFTYKDYGGGNIFVCAIDGVGRDFPRESCEPPCPPSGSCTFWGYYTRAGTEWAFSDLGSGARRVRDGETDGWRWGAHASGGCPPDASQASCGAEAALQEPAARGRSARSPIGLAAFVIAIIGLGGSTAWSVRARRRREDG